MSEDSLERIARLEARVERLEAELASRRGQTADTSIADGRDVATASDVWAAPAVATTWEPPTVHAHEPRPAREFTFDGEWALKWGGVALVVLAIGFAVSTAISRGWIGPELQLLGAVLVSAGLVAAGLHLRPTRPAWTHALCAAGVAAAATTAASNLFRDETSDAVAFAATAVVGVAALVLARATPSEWVASTGVVAGVTGWLVIGESDLPVVVSAIWFAAIVGLTVALSLERGWHASRAVAHAAGMIALLPAAAESDRPVERAVVLAVAAALAISLTRVPSIGEMRSFWQQAEVQLVMALGPWAFAIAALAIDVDSDRAAGATALAVAAGVLMATAIERPHIHIAHVVSLLVAASVAFSIGIALVFETSAVFVVFGVQAAGLVMLARALDDSVRVYVNASVMAAIALVYVTGEMIAAWSDDARIVDDLAHLAIIAALAFAAWQAGQRGLRQAAGVVVLALVLIWLGSVLMHLPQGQAAVSVAWAVVGTAVLVAGAVRRMPEVGAIGLVVLGITVAKLLTVDLREVDTLWRAGLFLLIGLGFLRLGFMLPRLSRRE